MKRWPYYLLIGLIFGVLDWFYLDWLARGLGPNLGENPFFVIPVIILLNYGIWLVPVIPVILYEIRQADQVKTPILAAILTWCSALFSYYAYYAILLSTGQLPNLTHLSLFGSRYVGFWRDYWAMFRWIILSQFLEWIPIAIIGGSIIAGLLWWLIKKPHRKAQHPQPEDD